MSAQNRFSDETFIMAIIAKPTQNRICRCVSAGVKWTKTRETLLNHTCTTLKIDDLAANAALRVENAHKNGQHRTKSSYLRSMEQRLRHITEGASGNSATRRLNNRNARELTPMKTIFVHVGPHKTGTTAIQNVFAASRDYLSDAGFHYLNGIANHSIKISKIFWGDERNGSLWELDWIDNKESAKRKRESAKEELLHELETCEKDNVVISGEELSRFSTAENLSFFRFLKSVCDNVVVIAYLRDPLEWATSETQEQMRGASSTLDEVFNTVISPHYEKRFTPIISACGEECFRARLYRPRQDGFNVVIDFCQTIGVDPAGLTVPAGNYNNSSMSKESAIAFSMINKVMPCFVEHRYNPVRSFKITSEFRLPGATFNLPREVIELSASALAQDCDWANQFHGKRIFSASVPSGSPICAWYPASTPEIEQTASAVAEAYSASQDAVALRNLLKAKKAESSNTSEMVKHLSLASLLCTNRWTMHQTATMMVEHNHPEKRKAEAKQRLMRRLLEPRPDDPPLRIGHPCGTMALF